MSASCSNAVSMKSPCLDDLARVPGGLRRNHQMQASSSRLSVFTVGGGLTLWLITPCGRHVGEKPLAASSLVCKRQIQQLSVDLSSIPAVPKLATRHELIYTTVASSRPAAPARSAPRQVIGPDGRGADRAGAAGRAACHRGADQLPYAGQALERLGIVQDQRALLNLGIRPAAEAFSYEQFSARHADQTGKTMPAS